MQRATCISLAVTCDKNDTCDTDGVTGTGLPTIARTVLRSCHPEFPTRSLSFGVIPNLRDDRRSYQRKHRSSGYVTASQLLFMFRNDGPSFLSRVIDCGKQRLRRVYLRDGVISSRRQRGKPSANERNWEGGVINA